VAFSYRHFQGCIRIAGVVALSILLSGCAAGNAKIASRKGYVRFPEKQYASGEKAEIGLKIKGEASYYGPGFHGKQTASGEIFDQDDYTCAHKSLPFGTKLKVVRVDNGSSVVVRVNDRGPYVDGRILDLSVAAGKQIGLDKVGHAEVVATVIE
jgi:rare lipoprotein A